MLEIKGKSNGDARVEMLERERESVLFFFWSPFCRFFKRERSNDIGAYVIFIQVFAA